MRRSCPGSLPDRDRRAQPGEAAGEAAGAPWRASARPRHALTSVGVTMGSIDASAVKRAPRRFAPPLPSGELILEPPPAIPEPTGARWQQWLSVLPMLAGTLATAMMFGGREGASPYTYVVGGVFGLSTLGMLVMNWGGASGPRKAELVQARRDYLRYLGG